MLHGRITQIICDIWGNMGMTKNESHEEKVKNLLIGY